MDFLLEALTNWLKEMLVGGIMSNHLKIIQVSTSCRLFLSAIIWIRSTVITIARITPAIGTMMEFDRFSIILKILPFHPCGVCPTCTDISATCWFTLSNIPERLLIIPPTSIFVCQTKTQA